MILVVDDDLSTLMLLEMALRRDGHVVRKASSAREALRILENDHERQCDLVITDIRMPDMDGRELFNQMRANRDLASIPVIMCTSVADRPTVEDLVGSGVRNYIVKPFRSSDVLTRVRSVLETAQIEPVIESRATTVDRLEIDELDYAPLANATVTTLDGLAKDLLHALRGHNAAAAHLVAERTEEPASIFGAHRALIAAEQVRAATVDLEVLHLAGILNTEIGELRNALAHSGLTRRA